ncbi:MAG: hypothetical protein ACI8V2_003151, partial [Candidatus Latescibacterota bacterium]
MFPNSKRVVNTLTHSIGLVLMLLMVAIPAQAQLQVAVDIQPTQGDGQLSETTSAITSAGGKVVVEVFATGFTNAQGVEIILEVADISAVQGNAQGTSPEFEVPINSTQGNQLKVALATFGPAKNYSGPLKLIATMTVTLSPTFTSTTIKVVSVDFGSGQVATPNLTFTVGDLNSLPIISGVAADLDSRLGNQGITNARINPGLLFPIEIYGGGLQKVTGFEIQLQMDALSNFDINNVRFEARTPFVVTPASGSGGSSLPTPTASSSPRAAADIVLGNRGDNRYNPDNLSVAGGSGNSVAIEFYGTGYQSVAGFTATFELSNPSAVQSITMNPGNAFPIKLSEPTLSGKIVSANLGSLAPGGTTAPSNDLLLLGTLIVNLSSNVGNGLGITVKSIAFQSAIAEDLVTPNAVLAVTGEGGTTVFAAPTVEISGNTLIARATSRLPVSGSDRLGTFGLSTSNTFRGGQITVSQITVSSDTKSTTLEPGIVLKLGSIVSDAPVVVRPPIPVTVTDTRAIIQWETNVISTGTIVYGTSRTNLDQEAQATSQDRVHTARLSGLTLGTRYFFQVTNTDERGTSEAVPPLPAQFVTRSRPDNQPPRVLLGPVAFGITNARADIVLETDEAAVIEVLYGTSQTDLSLTVSRSSSELRHKLVLESLTPNTRYFYRAKVTDLNGNPTTTDVKSFVTRTGADNFPPRILGRPSLLSRSFNATVVQWFTDEASNSTVIYGTDAASLTDSTTTDEATREHKISLGNLLTGAQYFYQVKSADASGNESISPTANFTTSTSEDTQ